MKNDVLLTTEFDSTTKERLFGGVFDRAAGLNGRGLVPRADPSSPYFSYSLLYSLIKAVDGATLACLRRLRTKSRAAITSARITRAAITPPTIAPTLVFFDAAEVAPVPGESPNPDPLGSTRVGIAEVTTVSRPFASVVVNVVDTVVRTRDLVVEISEVIVVDEPLESVVVNVVEIVVEMTVPVVRLLVASLVPCVVVEVRVVEPLGEETVIPGLGLEELSGGAVSCGGGVGVGVGVGVGAGTVGVVGLGGGATLVVV